MSNFLLVAAMEVEQKYILQALKNQKKITLINGSTLTLGEYNHCNISVLLSGIGKVNAAISTVLAIKEFLPDMIFNIGVAGGLMDTQKYGDIIIGSSIVYHDVDVRKFGYELGQIPGMPTSFVSDKTTCQQLYNTGKNMNLPVFNGDIISGDQFISSEESLKELNEKFTTAVAVEMEAAAIAHTAYLASIPFVIIRSISDKANENAKESYGLFLEQAAKNSSSLILGFLNR